MNLSKIRAADDRPEDFFDKIRRDGTRIYNLSYVNSHQRLNAETFLSYSMSPYEFSSASSDTFEKFITVLKKRYKVILVLAPYHPDVYKLMATKDQKFIQIETHFREMAEKLDVPIIGSYAPERVGCSKYEFLDGMHVKDSGMDKVMSQFQQSLY